MTTEVTDKEHMARRIRHLVEENLRGIHMTFHTPEDFERFDSAKDAIGEEIAELIAEKVYDEYLKGCSVGYEYGMEDGESVYS